MVMCVEREIYIENPRNHPPATVAALRALLSGGTQVRPDPKRPNFYEIEDDSIVYYIHVLPASGKVLLLATWPSEPYWNAWKNPRNSAPDLNYLGSQFRGLKIQIVQHLLFQLVNRSGRRSFAHIRNLRIPSKFARSDAFPALSVSITSPRASQASRRYWPAVDRALRLPQRVHRSQNFPSGRGFAFLIGGRVESPFVCCAILVGQDRRPVGVRSSTRVICCWSKWLLFCRASRRSVAKFLVEIRIDAKNLWSRKVAREVIVAFLFPNHQRGLIRLVIRRGERNGRARKSVLCQIVRLFAHDRCSFRALNCSQQRVDASPSAGASAGFVNFHAAASFAVFRSSNSPAEFFRSKEDTCAAAM